MQSPRFIPVPLDWPRGPVCLRLRETDPAHVSRFLWLLYWANVVNRAGAIVWFDGSPLTAADCAAQTDHDVAGWERCLQQLVDLDQLLVDEQGMQLLVWGAWRRESGQRDGRRWFPMPLDWPAANWRLRQDDPAHVWRWLWLISQAHLVDHGGAIVWFDGSPLTAADCAAQTDHDVDGWESSFAALERMEQLHVDASAHQVTFWDAWHLEPRLELVQASAVAPEVSQATRRPDVSTRKQKKQSSRSKVPYPPGVSARSREGEAFRKQFRRQGTRPATEIPPCPTPKPEVEPMSHMSHSDVPHVPPNVPHAPKMSHMSHTNVPHVPHQHEDQHEDRYLQTEKSCQIMPSSSFLEPVAPTSRPPIRSHDRTPFEDKEFWRIVDEGFRALTGQALTRKAFEFMVSKMQKETRWDDINDREVKAHALAWGCHQTRALIGMGKTITHKWPHAIACGPDHEDLIRELVEDNRFAVSRGRAPRPIVYREHYLAAREAM